MLPNTGKRVTYLLGAGASAKALPTVADMPKAFRAQRIWIREAVGSSLDNIGFQHYEGSLESLARKATVYGSVDTYARSLYLKKEIEKLNETKVLLCMYFLLEQAIERRQFATTFTPHPEYSRDVRIDTRYLSWLALMLDETSTMSSRVNMVSWNYDLQVEHALALFLGLEDITQVYRRPDTRCYPDLTSSSATGLPFLLHLNGVAGQLTASKSTKCLYQDLNGSDPKAYISKLFKIFFGHVKEGNNSLSGVEKRLTFAWEKSNVAETAINSAMEILERADVLVVIGYSFPSFNRMVDEKLIAAFRHSENRDRPKRIIIQSPHLTENTFWNMFNRISRIPTHIETDLTQFLVPAELFGG